MVSARGNENVVGHREEGPQSIACPKCGSSRTSVTINIVDDGRPVRRELWRGGTDRVGVVRMSRFLVRDLRGLACGQVEREDVEDALVV